MSTTHLHPRLASFCRLSNPTLQRAARGVIVAALLFPSRHLLAETNSVESLRLVPFPKEVRLSAAGLKLNRDLTIQITDRVPSREAAMQLQAELSRLIGGHAKLSAVAPGEGSFCFLCLSRRRVSDSRLKQALGSLPQPPESCALVVTDAFAAVGAREAAGLAHGIQTLRQLVRANLRQGRLPG